MVIMNDLYTHFFVVVFVGFDSCVFCVPYFMVQFWILDLDISFLSVSHFTHNFFELKIYYRTTFVIKYINVNETESTKSL